MENRSPLISIIIPAYNHERYVADAIRSVLLQSVADLEIIAIDDGSTDNTFCEMKKIKDPRIRLHHQENIGAAETINRGILLSRGRFIGILNSDDLYHPERLAVFKDYMEKHPGTMVLSSLIQPIDASGNDLLAGSGNEFFDYWLQWYDSAIQNLIQDGDSFFSLLQSNFVVSTSNLFLDARLFEENDKFDPMLSYCHDYAFLLRALQKYRFGFIYQNLLSYRLHDANTIRHNHFLKRLEVQYAIFHSLDFSDIFLNRSNFQKKISNLIFRGLEKNQDINHDVILTHKQHVFESSWKKQLDEILLMKEQYEVLKEKNENVLKAKIHQKDMRLLTLERMYSEKDRFLQEILNSKSWLWLTRYRSLKHKLTEKLKPASKPLPKQPPVTDANTYQAQIIHPLNSERPKIIHAIANFFTGGSSRLIVDLVEHLGNKYDQEVVCCYIPDPLAYSGLVLHDFSGNVTEKNIESFLRKKKAQILHVHYWGEGDAPWYQKVIQGAVNWPCILIENVNTPVIPYVNDRVDQYVYVSEYARDYAAYEKAKADVIYPGSNLTLFDRKDAPIPDDVIGMVYRLDQDKLREDAVQLFIQVVKKRPRTQVLIVGGGEYLNSYQRQVAEAGATANFLFTGYVPYGKLPEYYQRLSIFVAPVWKESFGQVSPFAMSMKIPVAGYRIGALSEILGSEELLADNPEDLSDIIVKLLDDRKRRIEIGLKNYQRVHEMFSIGAMVAAYERLYERLLQKKCDP